MTTINAAGPRSDASTSTARELPTERMPQLVPQQPSVATDRWRPLLGAALGAVTLGAALGLLASRGISASSWSGEMAKSVAVMGAGIGGAIAGGAVGASLLPSHRSEPIAGRYPVDPPIATLTGAGPAQRPGDLEVRIGSMPWIAAGTESAASKDDANERAEQTVLQGYGAAAIVEDLYGGFEVVALHPMDAYPPGGAATAPSNVEAIVTSAGRYER